MPLQRNRQIFDSTKRFVLSIVSELMLNSICLTESLGVFGWVLVAGIGTIELAPITVDLPIKGADIRAVNPFNMIIREKHITPFCAVVVDRGHRGSARTRRV